MEKSPDAEALKKIPMLAELPPWQIEVVEEAAEPVVAKKGVLILERGSDDGYTYFLNAGQIELQAADGQNKQVTIDTKTGESPIANLRPRLFGVRALSAVNGIRIPDIVLSAAGCTGQRADPNAITVESEDEERRHDAESKLSFHLYRDLKKDAVVLPTLPDLALRIRKTIDDDSSDARSIARLVESDPAMTAKLLKAANSAMYGGMHGVETTSAAVVRLGMQTTRQLVMSFAMKDVFACKDQRIRERMRGLWKHSSHIAALCFVLAREIKDIDAEEALLIGLVHDVGAIPILNYANKYPELTAEPEALELTIQRMRGELGAMILRDWHFVPEVVAGARDAEYWQRSHTGKADYTDLLIVAQVHERLRRHELAGLPPLDTVTAIQRVLGDDASPERSLEILLEAKAQVDEMRSVLHA
jgi:HD-like signal output (HDOD) protein